MCVESERYSLSSSACFLAPSVCVVFFPFFISSCLEPAQVSFRSARGGEERAVPLEDELIFPSSDPVLSVSSPVASYCFGCRAALFRGL